MINSIGVVPLYVSDQDAFVGFYVDKLGFELRFDTEVQPGIRWIEVGVPGSHPALGILSAAAFPDKPARSDWMTLHTADLKKTREELLEKGVELSDTVAAPWGDFCMITDPDGQQVVLAEVPI